MKHILLVEDNTSHSELILRSFEKYSHQYRIGKATSLAEAEQRIPRETPDLILADYRLPDGEGSRLIEISAGRYPVVIMTAFGDEQLAVKTIKAGALDYIVKMPETFSLMPSILTRVFREWDLILQRRLAEEKIQTLLREKESLLKQVHQRIKNNMVTVHSLLSLQAEELSDTFAASALRNAAGRVRGISLLYEQLYRFDDFTAMSMKAYLTSLIDDIKSRFPHMGTIFVQTEIEDLTLSPNFLSNLGMFINELVTNALKHAFNEEDDGRISITAKKNDRTLTVIVEDTGKGLSPAVFDGSKAGFGLNLVNLLAEQTGTSIQHENSNGTRIILTFAL